MFPDVGGPSCSVFEGDFFLFCLEGSHSYWIIDGFFIVWRDSCDWRDSSVFIFFLSSVGKDSIVFGTITLFLVFQCVTKHSIVFRSIPLCYEVFHCVTKYSNMLRSIPLCLGAFHCV